MLLCTRRTHLAGSIKFKTVRFVKSTFPIASRSATARKPTKDGKTPERLRELISIDEGVPVLIYAIADRTPAGFVLESFNIDRLDGEPLVAYPEPGDGLMVVEGNKRVGGADLRHLYGKSGS
ncbi:hypothetical protein A8H39_28410 [Paraburkholderia fungorum]|nr:hypothetical protein A8H39_28410 [Paraburkholderia fungorum]